jgi:Tfp pilus assembly PilM family ATPase
MRRHSITPVGVEMDSRWVHAVQLARSAQGWRTVASAEYRRTPGATLSQEAQRLRGVLDRRGFSGVSVVLVAPADQTLTGVLELPPRASRAPVHQLAGAELARLHKADPATLEVALWEIPAPRRGGAGCEYMVAACPHAAADECLDAFESAGLAVIALDLPQLAVVRAFGHDLRPAPSMDAVLHAGGDHCRVLVLVDGVVAYERRLEGAEGKVLVENAARRTGAPADAVEDLLTGDPPASDHPLASELRDAATAHVSTLLEQLQTSFAYISRRYPDRDLASVCLAGRYSRLEGLAQRLSGLQLRVVTAADSGAVTSPALLLAAGLALHEEGAPA